MSRDTITLLVEDYKKGVRTPSEVIEKAISDIENFSDHNIFVDILADEAREEAKKATELYKDKNKIDSLPPLLGVPYAIKSNILYYGVRATAGSRMLENYVSSYDATVINKLRNAGAVCLGTTNMDEFAMGSSTESSFFGPTKNPIDPKRVPGGSSGGSAAAVAGGLVPFALGTDTGGSIRQPASYCGVVGYKPTYGAVSRHGLIAMGSSLDQAGPLTRCVKDASLVHTIISGIDKYDATTLEENTYEKQESKSTYNIGVPRHMLKEGVDEDVLEGFNNQLALLKDAGHKITDISLPLFEKGLAAYYIVMPAEVSSNLARFDGIRYGLSESGENLRAVYDNTRASGFGPEVKRRILLGTHVLSAGYYDAYYGKAEQVRVLMREELLEQFKTVDFIVTPTAPTPAFIMGEKSDPIAMYAQDIFTVPVNLTGVPAISVPCGVVKRDGIDLPYGIQYIGQHGGDDRLFEFTASVHDTL